MNHQAIPLPEMREDNPIAWQIQWEQFYDEYSIKLAMRIRKQCWNNQHCEDVVQETFYRTFKYISSGRYKEVGKSLAFLSRIAKNIINDDWRIWYRYQIGPLYQTGPDGEEREIHISSNKNELYVRIDNRNELSELRVLIDKLGPRKMDAFKRIVIEEKSYAEVAKEFGIAESTVRSYVCKVRKELKQYKN